MKPGLLIPGIILMVISILLPVAYLLLDLLSLGFLTVITLGMDWVCCCSVSPLLFIIGLVLMILGIALPSKK